LIINRDTEGNAQGRLYLDSTDSLSTINDNMYEDYNIMLTKKQFTKYSNMDDTSKSVDQGFALKEITIADAHDLAGANFACFFNQSNQ